MNILNLILIAYILLFGVNEILNYIILEIVHYRVDNYLMDEKIDLNNRNELIIEALISDFTEEVTTSRWIDYLPFISIIFNINNLRFLEEDIEDFIYYLNQCYGDVLYPNGKHINDFTIEEKEEKCFFLSYEINKKIITFWVIYKNGEFEIQDASETFKNLSKKEQYQMLYEILKQIAAGNKKEYNYSSGLEEIIKPELVKKMHQKSEETELIRKRIMEKKGEK